MMSGDLELVLVYRTETGCLRAPLLSNTETIKWRKVYLPTPIILGNRIVKGISIPIVRNNRFRLAILLVYRPSRRALEIPIDSYLFKLAI